MYWPERIGEELRMTPPGEELTDHLSYPSQPQAVVDAETVDEKITEGSLSRA